MDDHVPTQDQMEEIQDEHQDVERTNDSVDHLADALKTRNWHKEKRTLSGVKLHGRAGTARIYYGRGNEVNIDYVPDGEVHQIDTDSDPDVESIDDYGEPFSFSYVPGEDSEYHNHDEVAEMIDDFDFSSFYGTLGWSWL